MAYQSQYDNKLAVKLCQQLQIRYHAFDWEPALIFGPVVMEYKR